MKMTQTLKKFVAIATLMASVMMVAAPGEAYALTADELAEQIAALQEQLAALTAQLDEVDGEEEEAAAVAVEGCDVSSFDRNLKQGMSGDDVKCLQIVMNSDPDTKLGDSGAGSPGNETSYFGPITKAGVIKFQEKYADAVLASWGLTAGTGFVGSTSRAKLNELLTADVEDVEDVEDEEEEDVEDEEEDVEEEEEAEGDLSVSSAGPAATTFVGGQATGALLDVEFSGTGTVVGIALQRIGISANTTPSNVYLFDGAVRLTDAGTVNSVGVVTFNDPNGLFVVSGTKTISVKSDIASVSGETLGMQLTEVTLASGAVSGLPVTGNLHSIASATLAGVSFGAITPGTSSIDAGNDVSVWESTATISTRSVMLQRLALRNIGSIVSSDIENFRLLISGVEVSQVDNLDANGYVTFDLMDAPLTMTTGARVFRVTADIVGGAGRTAQMSLRRAADVGLVDSSFNVNLTATDSYPASSGAITINSGSITTVKTSDSPSANVTDAGTDVVLAKYTVTVYGEPVKIETLLVDFAHVTSGDVAETSTLRNGRLMVNGAQVGSTTTLNPSSTGTSFTTNFLVSPGTPATIEVRADMFDNDGTDAVSDGDKITVTLSQGSSNAVRQISLGTINAPSANVAANQVTVASGSVSMAQQSTYPNQTIVAPQTSYKLAAFNLLGNSTEAVNISTFSLDIDEVSGDTFSEADLTDVYVKYGDSTTTVSGTVSAAANTWSVTFQLAKSESMPIEVYANVGSTITDTHSVKTDMTISGTTVDSAGSVDTGAVDGQTIATGSASLTATTDASRPDAAILDDSGTNTTAAFKFASVNDSYTIATVTLTIADVTAVANVMLKDGATVLATLPGATTVAFSGLSVAVPANSSKILTVDLEMAPVGVGAGSTGASVLTTLTAATALNSQGVLAAVTESDPAGQAMYVYKALPTVSPVTLPSGLLLTGTRTIAKFTVSSGGTGTIAWKQVLLTIAKTGGGTPTALTEPVIASPTLWNADTNTQITANIDIQGSDSSTGATACDENATTCELEVSVGTDADDDVLEEVSGARTYEVRAAITGTLATGDNININITQPSSFLASVAYASIAGTPGFVWSDVSAQSSDTGTTDWTNDYAITGLPTASQTMTK